MIQAVSYISNSLNLYYNEINVSNVINHFNLLGILLTKNLEEQSMQVELRFLCSKINNGMNFFKKYVVCTKSE